MRYPGNSIEVLVRPPFSPPSLGMQEMELASGAD